jgi:hypothetical protein
LSGGQHLRHEVGRDQLAAGLDQLGREEPGVADPGGEIQDRLARLGLDGVDHPGRDGHRGLAEPVRLLLPAERCPRPAVSWL